MKKLFLFMAVFTTVLLIVSCGEGSSSPESQPDDPKKDDTDVIPDADDFQQDDKDSVSDNDAGSSEEVPRPPEDCLYYRCLPPTPPECQLDESIVKSEAEHYFGFKGAGTINSADTSDPDWANLVKVTLKGVDGKDLDNIYSFFIETSLHAYDGLYVPTVTLEAVGDLSSTGRFMTIAFAMIPVLYIDILKEHKEFDGIFPAAPIVQIIDLVYTSDDAYLKECVIAENRYGMNEVLGQETAVGKTQACIGKYNDKTFSAGEHFKLAMNAELELVDPEGDAESADLCTCYKTEDWSVVDCSEISWE